MISRKPNQTWRSVAVQLDNELHTVKNELCAAHMELMYLRELVARLGGNEVADSTIRNRLTLA